MKGYEAVIILEYLPIRAVVVILRDDEILHGGVYIKKTLTG